MTLYRAVSPRRYHGNVTGLKVSRWQNKTRFKHKVFYNLTNVKQGPGSICGPYFRAAVWLSLDISVSLQFHSFEFKQRCCISSSFQDIKQTSSEPLNVILSHIIIVCAGQCTVHYSRAAGLHFLIFFNLLLLLVISPNARWPKQNKKKWLFSRWKTK